MHGAWRHHGHWSVSCIQRGLQVSVGGEQGRLTPRRGGHGAGTSGMGIARYSEFPGVGGDERSGHQSRLGDKALGRRRLCILGYWGKSVVHAMPSLRNECRSSLSVKDRHEEKQYVQAEEPADF